MKINPSNSSNKDIINTQTSIKSTDNSNISIKSNSSNDNKVKHIKKSRKEMLDVKRDETRNEELRKRETLIFMVRKTEKSFSNLYCIKDDEIIKYGGAHIQNIKTSKYLRKNFINGTDNINMNCSWNSIHNKWQPIDITDKSIDNFCDIEEYLKIKT